ncbi:maltotransferase domain-containing protein, partial [Cutibacterium acnes]
MIPESPATGTPRHAAPDPQDPPIDRPGQPPLRGFGRIGVHDVQPVVEGGRLPAYAVVDEEFEVTAHVFREGHDKVGATVVLTAPDGRELRTDMCQQEPMGLDIWSARVHADATGSWTMHVEGWSDLWHTWHHAAQAKLAADIDVDLVRTEGVCLAEAAFDRARDAGHNADSEIIGAGLSRLKSAGNAQALLTDVVDWEEFCEVMARHADRDLVSPTQRTPLLVERRRAL